MKRSFTCLAISALTGTCCATAVYAQNDFYIRSEHSNGEFTGFHEILTEPKDGYHQASYCDRVFWVAAGTVIWTEEENAAGRTLVLEENDGKSRTIVCKDNDAFVTLDELGLSEKEVAKIRAENEPLDMKSSRLRTIRDAFKQYK